MQRHLLQLQLFSVIRLHPSADLQHYPESHHPSHREFCGRPNTCFRTRFNAYQFKPKDSGRISLTTCSTWLMVLVSMSAKYDLQSRLIFTWMMSLTDTTGDSGVLKTCTCLRHDHCIAHKLPFELHSPAKGSLGPFSYTKRWQLTEHCAFETIRRHSTSVRQLTRDGVVHATWGSPTPYTRCFWSFWNTSMIELLR